MSLELPSIAELPAGLEPAGVHVMHLIGCALNGRVARPLPEGTTWEQVHALAKRNSVEAMVFLGAQSCADIPVDLRKQWEDETQMTLYRRLQFDAAREQVFAAMDEVGLSYLPMKGTILAPLYPSPEMRSMADNDFLYGFVGPCSDGVGFELQGSGAGEAERAKTVEAGVRALERVMRGLGYETVSLRRGNHDVYHKRPLLNFEPHRRLVAPDSPVAVYYENPWKRAIRDDANSHEFHFGDEDAYIYLIVHAHKHFSNSGCGVRYVVDIWVFLRARGARMDGEYVRAQLDELGLSEFERASRQLAEHLFGSVGRLGGKGLDGDVVAAIRGVDAGEAARASGADAADAAGACGSEAEEALDEGDRSLLRYLLFAGTYGNLAQHMEHEIADLAAEHDGDLRAAKRAYLVGRINSHKAVESLFPRASKIKVLYPFLQVARLVSKAVTNPRKAINELRILRRRRGSGEK